MRITGQCLVWAQPALIRHGEHRKHKLDEQQGRHRSHAKMHTLALVHAHCIRPEDGTMVALVLNTLQEAASTKVLISSSCKTAEALL